MRKAFVILLAAFLLVCLLGAIGANPRYVEELVVGGGTLDPVDGGIDFEKNGFITTTAGITAGGKVTAGAATTSSASLTLPHGTAPSSPSNGDVWTSTAGLFVRVNGATVGPLIPAAGVPWAAPGTIGSATPNTGVFTTLTTTGNATIGGQLTQSGNYQGASTEGLIGLWHMETLTPVLDWSGNGINGTVAGSGAALTAGKYGTGINFGATGELNLGNTIPNTYGQSDITFSLWFRTSSTNSIQYLVYWFLDTNHRFDLWLSSTGVVNFRMKENANERTITSPAGYNDDKWHHVVVVRDYTSSTNNNLTLYIDGNTAGTPLTGVALGDCGGNTVLYCCNQSGFGLPGGMDELAIWGRDLNGSEIRTIHGLSSGLVPQFGNHLVGNDISIVGGDVNVGVAGSTRGVLTLTRGAGGIAPSCIKMQSVGGSMWYLFVEDDGTLKVHTALPTSNANGAEVGSQS
jgi:hypothetical protein